MPSTESHKPSWAHLFRHPVMLALAILLALGFRPAMTEEPIRLVFAEGAAPLAFEAAGKVQGIEVDVAREVFTKRLGYPIEVKLYPWERAQQMVRSGEADGFISVMTPERDAYATCGLVPVLRTPMRAMMRRNHPQRAGVEALHALADLHKFTLVSYMGNGWAREKLAGFDVVDAVDFPASLRGLAQGRGDIALANALSGYYYLHQLNLKGKLVMLPQDFDTADYVLCMGDRSPHAAKLGEFERVLQVLRTDSGYARILKTYGLEPDASY